MLNQIILHGRLTRDPELRRTQSGVPVAGAGLAVDRDALNKDGVRECDFIDIVAWRSTAEFLCKHWRKGKEILVSGRLQMTSWNDNQGNKRWKAEVVAESVDFCGPKDAAPAAQNDRPYTETATAAAGDYAQIEGDDSELPF